ncbi:FAD-dependent oxidoreductase [bacterium]|nr:FAD-dependent oxidoreductase [bacterium]
MQLAENMATDLTIQTGSRVTKIDYTNTGVIVQYNSGDVMFANYVVVTVPLGVLKK